MVTALTKLLCRGALAYHALVVIGHPFTHRLRVRYNECDQQGVVFNGHYLFYYDVAFTELCREAIGSYADTVRQGVEIVVAEARLRFLAGAQFDDILEIDLPIARLGKTSMTVEPTFRLQERTLVEGEMRHVFVDAETMRKKEIPDNVRRGLEPYVVT
jgi:acyl-CoA thioester hydrolase